MKSEIGAQKHLLKDKDEPDSLKRKVEISLFSSIGLKKKPPLNSGLKQVCLSSEFKANHISLTEENLVAQGYKGYISILSNYPIIEGCYYYEAKILPPKLPLLYDNEAPHVRIGIGTKEFKCDYVLGYDNKSYAYRDVDGSVFHEGFSKQYGEFFKIDDVVGCLLYLKPPKPKQLKENILEEKKFEEINQGSKLFFFKNGICQGLAFENIRQGFYYMGVSLYNNAKVKLNFGPGFEYPPYQNPINTQIFKEINAEEIFKLIKPAAYLNEEESLYKEVKIF